MLGAAVVGSKMKRGHPLMILRINITKDYPTEYTQNIACSSLTLYEMKLLSSGGASFRTKTHVGAHLACLSSTCRQRVLWCTHAQCRGEHPNTSLQE